MIKPIFSLSAPSAVGSYSQGTTYSQNATSTLLYTSGQIPIHPETKKMPEDIRSQAQQALENVKNVLQAGGASLQSVLKVTIFLTNIDDFSTVNEVYSTFFTKPYPARSCIAVVALPLGAKIEIEAVAVTPG